MADLINSITRSNSDAVTRSGRKDEPPKSAGASVPAGTADLSDKLTLTDEASRMQKLQQSLANIPEVNAEKIAHIKQEIANGNYPIDAERIAKNMIDLENLLK